MSKTTRIIQQLSTNLLNMQRGRVKAIDYVMIKVPPSFAPIPSKRNFVQQQILGPAPMSLLEFVAALERIADDPRPLGRDLVLSAVSPPARLICRQCAMPSCACGKKANAP